MNEGWKRDKNKIVINPKIYCEYYLAAFSGGGKIWQYDKFLSPEDLERAKQRIIRKYEDR